MRRVLVAGAVLAAAAALVGRTAAAESAAPIVVRLGRHVFGHTSAGVRVVDTFWGKGPGQVGFVQEDFGPTGAASFDVVKGVVCILDQHNRRVLVFAPGKAPRAVPLRLGDLGQGDLAVGTDGTIYVLVLHGLGQAGPLRSFPARGGRPLAKVPTLGDAVRSDGAAAIVQAIGPGVGKKPVNIPDHWRQLMDAGRPATRPWLPYRPLPGGGLLDVRPDAPHGVVRLTLSRPGAGSTSWTVTAPGDFSVDDIDAVGSNAVLVLGFYNDRVNEEEVLVLGRKGLVRSFSTRVQHFAETYIGGDLRVDGSSLYRLGSTKRGVYVDRYSL
jgi:hypothetical protein